jgi:hypothetical protein
MGRSRRGPLSRAVMMMNEGHSDPVTEPPQISLLDAMKLLEDRAFMTYKCRLQAYRRLSRRNSAWNTSLVAFSTSTTIAAVGLLIDPQMYGSRGGALMVALAIMSLVTSLIVSSVNYGTRAKAMESNYKKIQRISVEVETLRFAPAPGTDLHEAYRDLLHEYGYAIDSSENHSDSDHQKVKSVSGTPATAKQAWRESLFSVVPYVFLVVPVVVLAPFVLWFFRGF